MLGSLAVSNCDPRPAPSHQVHELTAGSGEEQPADGVKLYQTSSGWIYEVWFMHRAIVIGCCATLAAARRQASLV